MKRKTRTIKIVNKVIRYDIHAICEFFLDTFASANCHSPHHAFHLLKYIHLWKMDLREGWREQETKSNERLAAILFPRYLYVRARRLNPGRILPWRCQPERRSIAVSVLPIKSNAQIFSSLNETTNHFRRYSRLK